MTDVVLPNVRARRHVGRAGTAVELRHRHRHYGPVQALDGLTVEPAPRVRVTPAAVPGLVVE